MPKEIISGGPAFPTDNEQQVGPSTYHYTGMTLRDYFASSPLSEKELDAIQCQYFAATGSSEPVSLSTLRYFHADQMLAEREKGARP